MCGSVNIGKSMRRRAFITLIGGTAAWPLAARAQQVERVRKIGILVPAAVGTPQWQAHVVAFRTGLRMLGWVDGRNVQVAERWGASDDELAAKASELVGISPDVILAAGASATRPMFQATRTVPIVFANVPDPVANGFVANLPSPGGNITGFANYEPKIAVKWLELLKELVPGVARVGFIFDPTTPRWLHIRPRWRLLPHRLGFVC